MRFVLPSPLAAALILLTFSTPPKIEAVDRDRDRVVDRVVDFPGSPGREPSPSTLVPLRGAAARSRFEGGGGQNAAQVLYSLGGGLEVSSRPSLDGVPIETVIVTTEEFSTAFQRLVDWKVRTGIPSTIRTVEWIEETYPEGVDPQERIRLFLRDAYTYWGTRSVIIGGGPDAVPIREARDYSWNAAAGGVSIPTDYYYACLDGNWNANGNDRYGEPRITNPLVTSDHADLIPELEVGRIPCDDIAQAERYLDDYLRYLSDPVVDYLDHVGVLGEVLFESDWEYGDCDECANCPSNEACVNRDGAEDCFALMDALRASDGGDFLRFTELYERDYWWIERGHPEALPLRLGTTLDLISDGVHVLFHSGRGDETYWNLGPDQLFPHHLDERTTETPVRRPPGLVYSLNAAFSSNVEGRSLMESFLYDREIGRPNPETPTVLKAVEVAHVACRASPRSATIDRVVSVSRGRLVDPRVCRLLP